jgi:hypothetical protein
MIITFSPRAGLRIESTLNGVLITESDYPEEDKTIFIHADRIGDVIDFLNKAQAKHAKKGFKP